MGQLNIPGVLVSPAKRIANPAGDVITFVKDGDVGFVGFGEAYGSFVNQGVRKGWRRHNQVTLNIVVPVGQIRFVLFDDRNDPKGQFQETVLGTDNYQRLTVPPGIWMAFEGLALGQSLLWNAINLPHDPDEADVKELSAIEYGW